jgi:hypothetical protein
MQEQKLDAAFTKAVEMMFDDLQMTKKGEENMPTSSPPLIKRKGVSYSREEADALVRALDEQDKAEKAKRENELAEVIKTQQAIKADIEQNLITELPRAIVGLVVEYATVPYLPSSTPGLGKK